MYAGKAIDAGEGRKLNVMVGSAYSWHDIDSRRQIAAGDALSDTAKASYTASTAQVFGEAGYVITVGLNYTLEPFAGVGYSDPHTGVQRDGQRGGLERSEPTCTNDEHDAELAWRDHARTRANDRSLACNLRLVACHGRYQGQERIGVRLRACIYGGGLAHRQKRGNGRAGCRGARGA